MFGSEYRVSEYPDSSTPTRRHYFACRALQPLHTAGPGRASSVHVHTTPSESLLGAPKKLAKERHFDIDESPRSFRHANDLVLESSIRGRLRAGLLYIRIGSWSHGAGKPSEWRNQSDAGKSSPSDGFQVEHSRARTRCYTLPDRQASPAG